MLFVSGVFGNPKFFDVSWEMNYSPIMLPVAGLITLALMKYMNMKFKFEFDEQTNILKVTKEGLGKCAILMDSVRIQ